MPASNPRISAVVDEELALSLRRAAEAENRSVSTLVRDILTRYFEEHEERHWVAAGESRLASYRHEDAVDHEDAWE